MTNALGIDVSRYNGIINWAVAPQNGVVFAGIRLGISWGYRDPFGASNWAQSKAVGLYRFGYHVIYPDQPIPAQVDNLLRAAGDDWDNACPVIDAELDRGATDAQITDALIEFGQLVQFEIGKLPVLYSRQGWIDEFTLTGEWRDGFEWWLANYYTAGTPEKPAPPTLPLGVDNWLVHQNADKMPAFPGFQSGGITTLDRNRWNGDAQAVEDWFNGQNVAPLDVWAHEIDTWAREQGYSGVRPA